MAHSSACARPDGWAHDESHRHAQADALDVLIGLARDTPAGLQRPSAGPPKPEQSAAPWPQGWTSPPEAGGQSADPVRPAPADGHVPELRPLNGRASDALRGHPRRGTSAADPLNGWREDGRGMNGGPVNGRAGNGPPPASSIVKRRPAPLRYGAPPLKGRVPEPRSVTPLVWVCLVPRRRHAVGPPGFSTIRQRPGRMDRRTGWPIPASAIDPDHIARWPGTVL